MKCKRNKKHGEMELLLSEDIGWKCKKCGSGIWDLTEQEMAIWKSGFSRSYEEHGPLREKAQRYDDLRKLLGIK